MEIFDNTFDCGGWAGQIVGALVEAFREDGRRREDREDNREDSDDEANGFLILGLREAEQGEADHDKDQRLKCVQPREGPEPNFENRLVFGLGCHRALAPTDYAIQRAMQPHRLK